MHHYRITVEVWPKTEGQLEAYEGTGEHQQAETRTHRSYRAGEIEAINEVLEGYRKPDVPFVVASILEVSEVYKTTPRAAIDGENGDQ